MDKEQKNVLSPLKGPYLIFIFYSILNFLWLIMFSLIDKDNLSLIVLKNIFIHLETIIISSFINLE